MTFAAYRSRWDQTVFRIRELGERLDAHRKKQQSLHPDLTLTGMYNVLEKLRSGHPLTAKEKTIHEQGLVSVLKQIHDDLDAAVFDAYRWPHDLTDEQILERLVALNAERAEEEQRGLIRWLRPELQNPSGKVVYANPRDAAPQRTIESEAAPREWPKQITEQVHAVRRVIADVAGIVTPAQIASAFRCASANRIAEICDSLAAIGRLRKIRDGFCAT